MLQNFHTALNTERMEQCSQCNEHWFDMRLFEGICKECRKYDKDRQPDHPLSFSTENHLDPGPAYAFNGLPDLSQTEAILIAPVHVFVEIRRVRGQQYRYTGHVINFFADTGKIYRTLPSLPEEVKIFHL